MEPSKIINYLTLYWNTETEFKNIKMLIMKTENKNMLPKF